MCKLQLLCVNSDNISTVLYRSGNEPANCAVQQTFDLQ